MPRLFQILWRDASGYISAFPCAQQLSEWPTLVFVELNDRDAHRYQTDIQPNDYIQPKPKPMTNQAAAPEMVWDLYSRYLRRIGAAVAVEDCARRRQRLLPVPTAAVMALALSGVRDLDLNRLAHDGTGWEDEPQTAGRLAHLSEFLSVAPVNFRSLQCAPSHRQPPLVCSHHHVIAALRDNRCNAHLRRLDLFAFGNNISAAAAQDLLAATGNLRSLRSLSVAGEGAMAVVDAVLPQLRCLSVRMDLLQAFVVAAKSQEQQHRC